MCEQDPYLKHWRFILTFTNSLPELNFLNIIQHFFTTFMFSSTFCSENHSMSRTETCLSALSQQVPEVEDVILVE